jgi:hypothetical protein
MVMTTPQILSEKSVWSLGKVLMAWYAALFDKGTT